MSQSIGRSRLTSVVLLAAIALVVAALALAAGPVQPADAAVKTVAAGVNSGSSHLNVFSPKYLRVKRGTKVKWVFSGRQHNVVGNGWSSPLLKTGSWSKVFKRKGKYSYLCTLHSGMTGKITVY